MDEAVKSFVNMWRREAKRRKALGISRVGVMSNTLDVISNKLDGNANRYFYTHFTDADLKKLEM